MPVTFFFVGHELEHAQGALDICQNAKTLKTPTKLFVQQKMSIADLFLMEFLGNLLMTLIDLVS